MRRTPCNAVCPCDAMLQDAAIMQAVLEVLNCLEPGDTVSDGSHCILQYCRHGDAT